MPGGSLFCRNDLAVHGPLEPFEQDGKVSALAGRAIDISIRPHHCGRAGMRREPSRVDAVDVIEHGSRTRPPNDGNVPPNRRPGIAVRDRQATEHAYFRRDNAPAGADDVVEQALPVAGAHAALRENAPLPATRPPVSPG